MAGIPDMLTDIRTTGQGVPMGGQPPMGMGGQPPMGRPPQPQPQPRPNMPNQSSMTGQPLMNKSPMNSGIASMGGGQPPMGGGQPPMGMEEPPREEAMTVEKDAAMLVEATVGRTQGDIGAAVAILDTAKAMLMSAGSGGGGEEPMMMNMGGPMYKNMGGPMYANMGGDLNPGLQALQKTNPEVVDQIMNRNMGGPMYANMGRPLYAQEGKPVNDTETMKQMIMNSIRNNPVLNSEGVNSISSMGYNPRTAISQLSNDVLGRDVSNRDKDSQEAANAAIAYQMSLR